MQTQTQEVNFLHKMSAICCSKDGCPSSGARRLAFGVWVTSGSSVVWWLRATGFYERGRGPGVWNKRKEHATALAEGGECTGATYGKARARTCAGCVQLAAFREGQEKAEARAGQHQSNDTARHGQAVEV